MNILVDSSVWIDYFRSGKNSGILDRYIDQNVICINNLILAELVPFLSVKRQTRVIKLLNDISKIPINVEWNNIIDYQIICLKNGINKVGISDLIILDNIIQSDLMLFSLDKHFDLIHEHINFEIM